MGMIVFNGTSSTDFGINIEEYPAFVSSKRRGEVYQIAGQNGSEVSEDGTFENYTQTYKVNIKEGDQRHAHLRCSDVAAWLLSSSGYCRLEDGFQPEFFRLARFAGPLNIEQIMGEYGESPLEFDCKPERYLKSGEKAVTLLEHVDLTQAGNRVASSKINNPTRFVAAPLIRVTGTGSFRLEAGFSGSTPSWLEIKLSDDSTPRTVIIDCKSYAIQMVTVAPITIDASNRVTYLTKYPTLPKLQPGENRIDVSGYYVGNPGVIEKFEIIPRWWTA